MGVGSTAAVHTKVSYAGASMPSVGSIREEKTNADLKALEDLEKKFYESFGCHSFEEFMATLRSIFSSLPQDKKAFNFFSGSNIRKALEKAFGFKNTKDEVTIDFTYISEGAEINIPELLSGANFSVSGGVIHLGADLPNIKNAVNVLFNRHFKTKAGSYSSLDKFLKSLKDQKVFEIGGALVTINDSALYKELHDTQTLGGDAFNNTIKEINAAKNGDKEAKAKLDSAMNEVWHFIQGGIAGCSSDMRKAIEQTWKKQVMYSYEGIALFQKGGNMNQVVGAFGEFQTALLFNYIDIRLRSMGMNSLATGKLKPIISESIGKGRQPKVDVTLLRALGVDIQGFGIQVKNFRENANYVDVNTTPQGLMGYPKVGEMLDGNFLPYLANYYFNADFKASKGDVGALESELSRLFAEISSLATAQLPDKVAFYFIGGTQFIPASHLYRSIQEDPGKRFPVRITGPAAEKGDEAWLAPIQRNGRTEGAFIPYWAPTKGGGGHNFQDTGKASGTYAALVNSRISIRGKIKYSNFKGSNYSIFNF